MKDCILLTVIVLKALRAYFYAGSLVRSLRPPTGLWCLGTGYNMFLLSILSHISSVLCVLLALDA